MLSLACAKCFELGSVVSYLASPPTRVGAHGATQLGSLPILLSPAAVAPKSTTRHQVLADEEISCCKAVSRTGLTYQECRPPPVTQCAVPVCCLSKSIECVHEAPCGAWRLHLCTGFRRTGPIPAPTAAPIERAFGAL